MVLGKPNSHLQVDGVRTYPHTMHKNKLKVTLRLNIRHNHIKLLEEDTSKTSSDTHCTNVVLGQSSTATEIKAKINKWDPIKLTSFCLAKEAINRMKRQPVEWKQIFAIEQLTRAEIFKIYK